MSIKTIGILAISAFLMMPLVSHAEDDIDLSVDEYEEYEVFEDVTDLIDEEFYEPEDVTEVEIEPEPETPSEPEVEVIETPAPAPRVVADRLSCDEIAVRVAELRADVKSYPELKGDLETMLTRQRNQCAPRAARRPVRNYNNVNPVTIVEVPQTQETEEVPQEPEKTPEEIAAEAAAAEEARQAQIAENMAKGLCGDGTKPNKYGCCEGEIFKQVEHLNFACCPKDGDGECRAPFKK